MTGALAVPHFVQRIMVFSSAFLLMVIGAKLAEGGRFELPRAFRLHTLSRRAH